MIKSQTHQLIHLISNLIAMLSQKNNHYHKLILVPNPKLNLETEYQLKDSMHITSMFQVMKQMPLSHTLTKIILDGKLMSVSFKNTMLNMDLIVVSNQLRLEQDQRKQDQLKQKVKVKMRRLFLNQTQLKLKFKQKCLEKRLIILRKLQNQHKNGLKNIRPLMIFQIISFLRIINTVTSKDIISQDQLEIKDHAVHVIQFHLHKLLNRDLR